MSNAYIRKHLERTSAPLVAFLIDNGWVDDDCGVLNSRYGNIREGLIVASRATQGHVEVPVPDIRSAADRHNTPMSKDVAGAIARGVVRRMRERL